MSARPRAVCPMLLAVDPPLKNFALAQADRWPVGSMGKAVEIPATFALLRVPVGGAIFAMRSTIPLPHFRAVGVNDGRAVLAVIDTVDPPFLGARGNVDSRAVETVELTVNEPPLPPIRPLFRWTVFAMEHAIDVPFPASIRSFDSRGADPMEFAVNPPFG